MPRSTPARIGAPATDGSSPPLTSWVAAAGGGAAGALAAAGAGAAAARADAVGLREAEQAISVCAATRLTITAAARVPTIPRNGFIAHPTTALTPPLLPGRLVRHPATAAPDSLRAIGRVVSGSPSRRPVAVIGQRYRRRAIAGLAH